jgi:hypothetical protein
MLLLPVINPLTACKQLIVLNKSIYRLQQLRICSHAFKSPCSFGLSATSQQYFSLRINQPSPTSQQYFSLRTNQHQPSATSQQYFSLRINQSSPTSQQYFSLRTNQHQPSATSRTNRLMICPLL